MLILDVACVDSLVRTVGPPAVAAVLVVAGAGSRAFAVGVAFVARRRAVGDGMGARFAASVSSVAVLVAGGSALGLSVVALPVVGPIPALALIGGAAVATVLVAAVVTARRQLDGDGLGAAVELTFSAILLAGVVAASFLHA